MDLFINLGTWYSLLHEVNFLSILIRISMALLMGGVLGAERGLRNRPAGFMTYVLVCMGASIIMLTNQYIFTAYAQEHSFVLFDMQRGKIKTLSGEMGTLIFSIELTQKVNHAVALDSLYSLEGVEYLKELS